MTKNISTNATLHIDNGGPSFDINTQVDSSGYQTTSISLYASYYGYPSIQTSIRLSEENQVEFLKAIKDSIDTHLDKMDKPYSSETTASLDIDNGGPLFNIHTNNNEEDDYKTTDITLSSSYYGHPSVESSILLSEENQVEFLEKIRDVISNHLALLRNNEKTISSLSL